MRPTHIVHKRFASQVPSEAIRFLNLFLENDLPEFRETKIIIKKK